MIRYLRKRYFGLYVLILLLMIGFQLYLYVNPISNLSSSFGSIHFESNHQDHKIKELKYMISIRNSSNKKILFHAVITRPKADWYPYLDSIPEKYYSNLMTIDPKQGGIYEIEDTYHSQDHRITGGSLGDLKVEFISEEEYQKLFKNDSKGQE